MTAVVKLLAGATGGYSKACQEHCGTMCGLLADLVFPFRQPPILPGEQ